MHFSCGSAKLHLATSSLQDDMPCDPYIQAVCHQLPKKCWASCFSCGTLANQQWLHGLYHPVDTSVGGRSPWDSTGHSAALGSLYSSQKTHSGSWQLTQATRLGSSTGQHRHK